MLDRLLRKEGCFFSMSMIIFVKYIFKQIQHILQSRQISQVSKQTTKNNIADFTLFLALNPQTLSSESTAQPSELSHHYTKNYKNIFACYFVSLPKMSICLSFSPFIILPLFFKMQTFILLEALVVERSNISHYMLIRAQGRGFDTRLYKMFFVT